MLKRIVVLSVALLIAAAAIERAASAATVAVPIRKSLVQFPLEMGDWHGRPGQPFEKKVLDVLGVDEYSNLTYLNAAAGRPVGLYIGYYASQQRGDIIHSPLNCLPGSGWEPISNGEITIDVGGPSIRVNRYVIRKGLERYIVFYWYQSHGRAVADEYTSRAYMVLDAIRSHRTDAALVRVIVPMADSESETEEGAAERAGVSFVQTIFPLLGEYLPA
jgi:EpsI family protein